MTYRYTFNGKKIKYTDLSHQHLSNIYWFNKLIRKRKSELELVVIECKYDGIILSYRPSCQFPEELIVLRELGYLQDDGKIIYDKKEIGHVVNSFN